MNDPSRAKMTLSAFTLTLCLVSVPSFAAQVRGSVDASPAPAGQGLLGYTKTRVALHAAQHGTTRPDLAVFLAAKESGVIPAPMEPYKVTIAGLELKPNIAACVIDGKVSFTNDDRTPVTLVIQDHPLGVIAPGASLLYECKTGEPKLRRIRVKEWPHVRGGLFVGEVGVVASVNANGSFSMAAPQGKYEVQVLSEGGPVATKAIEVKAADIDVGKLSTREGAEAAVAPVEDVPPKKEPALAAPKKEPAGVLPVKKEPAVAPVKKEGAAAQPLKKDFLVLPSKKEPAPTKKKEPSARPSTDQQELDFGEQ